MSTINMINTIQTQSEKVAKESEVIKHLDLAGTYGEVSQELIDIQEKEYLETLRKLKTTIDDYLKLKDKEKESDLSLNTETSLELETSSKIETSDGNEMSESLKKSLDELLPHYEVEKVKSCSVYVWDRELNRNIFDICAHGIVIYDKHYQIKEDVVPIIEDIQEKLRLMEKLEASSNGGM